MDYKVETKNSLWKVGFSCGGHSSRREAPYVFSGNSEEEVWAFVKLWAKEVFEKCYWEGSGLIYNGEKFLVHPATKSPEEDIDWDTDYGDAQDVSISRLEVIYVNP